MVPISELWEVYIGKNKHIVNRKERDLILNAGENRFVVFKDLVVNPAFVSDMKLIKNYVLEIEGQTLPILTREQILRTQKIRKEIKEKIKHF